QLGKLYIAGVFESCNLLDYYYFKSDSAEKIKENIENLLGQKADEEILKLPTGNTFYNPYFFYAKELEKIKPFAMGNAYFSYIHGDLNGANIIIDSHENVWLIDFFHTHRGHILKDLAKLENDLLYIFTKIDTEEELLEGMKLIDFLVRIKDLGALLPEIKKMDFKLPEIQKAYNTLRHLRSFYPELIKEDRNSIQLFIALLRYSIHTLSFDEPNKFQKLLALYASGVYSYEIKNRLSEKGRIRIDYFSENIIKKGKLGLTILPGRKDLGHNLSKDIETIKNLGVTHIVTLIKDNEFHYYGVDDLMDSYHKNGFKVKRLPILDQKVPPFLKMKELVLWIDKNLEKEANIMVHCAGGLGRAGITAACYLVYKGFSPEEAIKQVRVIRSSRAVETILQEKYVNDFSKNIKL
ncbi:MAG: dual specificity protein phosphatase family protein, partial [Cyanobacteriota bacterium]